MAVTFAQREGIANTCWTGGKGGSPGGCAIQFAAQNANATVMRALLDAGVDVTDQTARNALADAANQGSLEIVKMLVEKGGDPHAAIAPRSPSRHRDRRVPREQGREGRRGAAAPGRPPR